MIHTVYGQDAAVSQFVVDQLADCTHGFGACKAIGFSDGSDLIAGVVYHNWSPEARVIEVSSASTRRDWLNKARLKQIFGYPFDQIGVQMCIARMSEHNTRARRIWKALGATEFHIPRLRGPDEAEVISTLTVETWRDGNFGRKPNG